MSGVTVDHRSIQIVDCYPYVIFRLRSCYDARVGYNNCLERVSQTVFRGTTGFREGMSVVPGDENM
jgi:hypothetical protein